MGNEAAFPHGALEREIRAHCEAGDLHAAATRAVQGYGAEVLGYLYVLARDESEAAEAFSMFNEDLWRGLPRFRWECRLRTWAYTLARRALLRFRRDPHRRPGRFVAGTADIAERLKSSTLPHLRSSVQDRLAEIRKTLDLEDRMQLVLRVDRELDWIDVARVMSDDDDVSEPELSRLATKLRKRFQRLKQRIREQLARGHDEERPP